MFDYSRIELAALRKEDTYCYLPSEEEIQRETAKIRQGWSDNERRRRAGYRNKLPVFDLDRMELFNSNGRPFNL